MKPDALALEYQADYGSARKSLDINNIVNNPNAFGVVRVFGPGFFEGVPLMSSNLKLDFTVIDEKESSELAHNYFSPGTYGCHEVLHMTSFLLEAVELQLL